jgi:hypothetical protein
MYPDKAQRLSSRCCPQSLTNSSWRFHSPTIDGVAKWSGDATRSWASSLPNITYVGLRARGPPAESDLETPQSGGKARLLRERRSLRVRQATVELELSPRAKLRFGSVHPSTADTRRLRGHVRFVPRADAHCAATPTERSPKLAGNTPRNRRDLILRPPTQRYTYSSTANRGTSWRGRDYKPSYSSPNRFDIACLPPYN